MAAPRGHERREAPMAVPKIQTVCGYGCGSSLMLRMNVEKIA